MDAVADATLHSWCLFGRSFLPSEPLSPLQALEHEQEFDEADVAKLDCVQKWCVLLIAWKVQVHAVHDEQLKYFLALLHVVHLLVFNVVLLFVALVVSLEP